MSSILKRTQVETRALDVCLTVITSEWTGYILFFGMFAGGAYVGAVSIWLALVLLAVSIVLLVELTLRRETWLQNSVALLFLCVVVAVVLFVHLPLLLRQTLQNRTPSK